MRKTTIAALCAAATALSAGTAAQANRYERQVRLQLLQLEELLERRGYAKTHAERVDALHEGRSDSFTFTLQKGREYFVVSTCDVDCRDLDLRLHDENGHLIAEDLERDDMPVVRATPRWTGEFELRVRMHSCAHEPCAYGIAIYAEAGGRRDDRYTRL